MSDLEEVIAEIGGVVDFDTFRDFSLKAHQHIQTQEEREKINKIIDELKSSLKNTNPEFSKTIENNQRMQKSRINGMIESTQYKAMILESKRLADEAKVKSESARRRASNRGCV